MSWVPRMMACVLATALSLAHIGGNQAVADAHPADTPLRVMAFNIFLGGTNNGGKQNLDQLIEFVRQKNPDVLFAVETYGSGRTIEAGLNKTAPSGGRYRGVPITREPGQADDEDNLWIFTRYPIAEVYPRINDGPVTSFNFGGARLRLPSGRQVNVFNIWLDALERAWLPVDTNALDRAYGGDPPETGDQLADSDYARRYDKARTILQRTLPRLVPDSSDPIIIGGDMNTLSAHDWSAQFADAYSHEGLVIDWPVTGAFHRAGFTDTYRATYPDASRYPGRTWSTYWGFGYTPARIDYIWTRGDGVAPRSAHTRTERLPRHRRADFADEYPFYSDHGALVTDLTIEGGGGAPFGIPSPERDAPEGPPQQPHGTQVAPEAITAQASSAQPGSEPERVLDEDPTTFWNSSFDPHQELPQSITLDLGRKRAVAGLVYEGHLIGRAYDEPGNVAGIDRYQLSVSTDGNRFVPVDSGQLERNRRPQWIPLRVAPDVRYVRLTAVEGFTETAGAEELAVYETGTG